MTARLDVEASLTRRNEEGDSAYVSRVSKLLPTWPEDVLLHFVANHPGYVSEFASALPLERLRFELVQRRSDDLPGAEVFLDEEAFSYATEAARTGEAEEAPWFSELWRYMKDHGTWPCPIVLVRTAELAPFSIRHPRLLFAKSRHPLQILDGHRRLAFAHVLRERGVLPPTLPVWMVAA